MKKTGFLIFLVPLFLALPFINRAYFVDDHYFVEIATWLKDHPSLPYDFRADDAGLQNRGWEKNGFVRMVNPLAHHYYMALLMKVWQVGQSTRPVPEWFLRLGCVLLSCASAWLLLQMSRRWTYHPVLSTLLILMTPTFWLSSYSLLIDPTMLFFSLAGLYLVIRSVELDSLWRNWGAGIFLGLAILAKYPALFMLPLCAVWIILNVPDKKRLWRSAGVFVIALAFLVAYSLWTANLYGSPHIIAASRRMVQMGTWPKIFSLLVFFSGSLLLPLIMWWLTTPRLAAISALLGVALFALLAGSLGGFTWLQAILLSIWLSTTFVFFGDLILRSVNALLPYLNSRSYAGLMHYLHENRHDVFLVFWLLGFMWMMVMVMNWVAVRYYCLVLPAAVWMIVRLVERRRPAEAARVFGGLLICLFVATYSLAYSDQQQAEPSRKMGARLLSNGFAGGDRHFYLGDSFTMSYLKDHGWTPAFSETQFRPGDLVLSKDVTMPLVWFFHRPLKKRLLAIYDFPSHFPLKVMDYNGSAGFYASVWGALPFTWSRGPWERFELIEIVEVPADVAS